MTLHQDAMEVFDLILKKVEANRAANNQWWDSEPTIYREPTQEELQSKLASVERRLKKADEAFEALLDAQGLDYHHQVKADPKSMDQVKSRQLARAKLHEVIAADPNKLTAYRAYGKLLSQRDRLRSKAAYLEDATEETDAPAPYQLAIDLPNQIESSQHASAVKGMINRALEDAGIGYSTLGVTSSHQYYDMGKMVLEINDPEEALRFQPELLNSIDWHSAKPRLEALESELRTASGWRKHPGKDGDVFEKIADTDDLQARTLQVLCMSDFDDPSDWDNWRPLPPKQRQPIMLNSMLTDAQGKPAGGNMSMFDDSDVFSDEEPGEEKPKMIVLDPTQLYLKTTVNAQAAGHYLQNMLGIEGLDIPAQDQGAQPQRGV